MKYAISLNFLGISTRISEFTLPAMIKSDKIKSIWLSLYFIIGGFGIFLKER